MISFFQNRFHSLFLFSRKFSSRKFSSLIIISLFTIHYSLITSCKTTETAVKDVSQPEAKVNGVTGQDPKATELENTFLEAKKQEIIGNSGNAITLYNACLKIQPENDAVNFQLANIFYQTQKYPDALAHIKISVKQSPTNKYYEQLYAEILNRSGNPKAAGEVYGTLCKQQPTNVDYLFNYAYFLALAGQFQQAIDAYNKIEAQVGVQEDLSMEKQRLYGKMGKPQLGVAEIQKLADANPTEPRYLAMLADMYSGLGENEKLIEVIKKLAAIDPNNATAQLALADYYSRNNDNEKYFSAMKNAFALPGMNIDTKVKVLLTYLPQLKDESKRNEALELGNILIATHPNDSKSYIMYADLMYKLGMNEAALTHYQLGMKINNSRFIVWQQVLYLESTLKLNDSLEHDAMRCIELFPSQEYPYQMLGYSQLRNKKYDRALISFSQAVVIGSDDKMIMADLYFDIGDTYYALKKYNLADSCYKLSLTYDSNNMWAMNNDAFTLVLLGKDLDKALSLTQKALAQSPNDNAILDTYGWILYKQKKYADAKIQIEKSLQNGGDTDPGILEHYGDILFQLGETDHALEQWTKAKALNPDSEMLDKKIADKKLYE